MIPIGNHTGNSAERGNSLISTMSKLPIAPYIKQIPNKIIPEAKEPIKKYFIPASLLLIFNRSLAAKTYNEIEFGITEEIGYFVCDNESELVMIQEIAKKHNKVQNILFIQFIFFQPIGNTLIR